ncbi:hypothetical protein [Polyangium spumosum]|uniref:Uncharacterized protein n=1 Tax=Polyangium spumosum TaxID=889282 RepID=A0A6N7PYE3_9BACT|nr:hypothetical protein [Polyangium spumosum]MRG96919.1 hypothetical protein [Polyangium spumosum]
MSPIRLLSLVLVSLSAGLFLGCPGTDGDNDPSGTAGTGGVGGAGGAGGAGGVGGIGGAGGMTTSSTGAGGTPTCTDYSDVPEVDCNLLAQDCEDPNASCRPSLDGTATVCEGGAGIKGVGAPCTQTPSGLGECGVGLYCVFGFCSPICCQSAPEQFCGSAQCNVYRSYGQSRLWLCNFAKSCTLFDGKECPDGHQCRLSIVNQDLSLCAPLAGAGVAEGEACDDLNDCGANQRCEAQICRYTCLVDGAQNLAPGSGGCPTGQTCNPLPGTTTYGFCSP